MKGAEFSSTSLGLQTSAGYLVQWGPRDIPGIIWDTNLSTARPLLGRKRGGPLSAISPPLPLIGKGRGRWGAARGAGDAGGRLSSPSDETCRAAPALRKPSVRPLGLRALPSAAGSSHRPPAPGAGTFGRWAQ